MRRSFLSVFCDLCEIFKIRTRGDFVKASHSGLFYRSRVLLVQGRRNGLGFARVGFTATKKVGNAVVRNRCKRRMRAAASEILPVAGMRGMDYVFVARGATCSAEWRVLLAAMRSAVAYINRS